MQFDKKQKEQYCQGIYRTLVEENTGALVIKKPFRCLIQPYGLERLYPHNRIGTLARITPRYIENWVNFGRLVDTLNWPQFRHVFSGLDNEQQLPLVQETLGRIGNDSYLTEEEWRDRESCRQIDSIIEPGTKITHLANQLLTTSLEQRVREYLTYRGLSPNERFVIADVGCGTGNTIMPLIEVIDEFTRGYRRSLEIILIDGQEEALNVTARRINGQLSGSRNLKKKVTTVKENFGCLHRNPIIIDYLGQADIIVSGAAVMHTTNKQPFFNMMYDLLREGGTFACWDWYFKSFLAPNLRKGPRPYRIVTFEDRSGNRTAVELDEDEHFTPEMREKQRHCNMNVIGVLPEKDLSLALRNNLNWLWLYGYVRRNPDTGEREEKKVIDPGTGKFVPVSQRLHEMFLEKVNLPTGFNFIEDFLSQLIGISPFRRTAYNYIESYGDEYAPQLLRSGFMNAEDLSLAHLLRRVEPKPDTYIGQTRKETIKFTYAVKKGYHRPPEFNAHRLGK